MIPHMTSDLMSSTSSKKRRIMLITGDESIIEQIQNNNNSSLLKSIIIEEKKISWKYFGFMEIHSVLDADSEYHKSKTGSLTCVVCSAPALGHNFDAITCESCKAFFRRNALKDSTAFQCRRKNCCEITIDSRRRCSACRLAKCFSKGMKSDRLQTTEEKEIKLRKIEANRHLNDTKSHSISSTFLDHLTTSNDKNLTDFIDILPQVSSQPRRTLLSSEDLQRVETIQISYKQRIELAARDGLPWNPSVYATTPLQHLNSRSVSALRLLTFFKQIPEFNQLNVDDKVILIKHNLMTLVIINGTLSYRVETDQVVETDSDVPWNTSMIRKLHGDETYIKLKRIFDSFLRIAQYDQKIIQVALIVLILTTGFSTNIDTLEPTFTDGIAVYRAHNYYTELLWKYMESVHGFEKATCVFHELVIRFISWQTMRKELQHNLRKVLSPTDVSELLPVMRSLLNIP